MCNKKQKPTYSENAGWLFAFISKPQSYHFPDLQHLPNKLSDYKQYLLIP